MASLTFAEAKVVAPPILPRKHPANTAQLFPINLNRKNKNKTKKKKKKKKNLKLVQILKGPPYGRGLMIIYIIYKTLTKQTSKVKGFPLIPMYEISGLKRPHISSRVIHE